VLLQNL